LLDNVGLRIGSDAFVREFNAEPPHEAFAMKCVPPNSTRLHRAATVACPS
jgi:hypothetical protein